MSRLLAGQFNSALRKGDGWRIGWQPERGQYCALVGGDRWAIELTELEWRAFVAAFAKIQAEIAAVAELLMAEESVILEQQSEALTLAASGILPEMSLYLQVHSNRRGEGFWDSAVVPELWAAVEELSQFSEST